ncbi:MAG TPA: flippase [Thermoanaerobaculia bacterium]|nr:flippase [Thermoanaerobaculia bacterium]
MPSIHSTATAGAGASAEVGTRAHLRGSSLLLAGRLLSLGLNFVTQVITVRYLTKQDYGAFAYALSVVSFGSTISLLGLNRAAARFLPIYEERRQWSELFGGICVVLTTLAGLGLAFVLTVLGLRSVLHPTLIDNAQAADLLVILVALAPVAAFDTLLVTLFAVFSGPRAIFLRKHVLGPLLNLAAISAVVLWGGGVSNLAVAQLTAGVVGVALYSTMLVRTFRRRGWWEILRQQRLVWPVREFFGFSLPLLSSDVVLMLRGVFVVVFLERLVGATAVAEYRAVSPVAHLNMIVEQSFAYLFLPLAARLVARGDREGIASLYRRTAGWIAVLSFPIFVVTAVLAAPLAVLLYGDRYASSGAILAWLALGHLTNAALGFNAATLRALGRVRVIVASDLASVLTAIVSYLLLIPVLGATGAAIGTTLTLVVRNLFNQVALRRELGVTLLTPELGRPAASILVGALIMLAFDRILHPPLWLDGAVVALLWIALLRVNRKCLELLETLPELGRVPGLRRLLGS